MHQLSVNVFTFFSWTRFGNAILRKLRFIASVAGARWGGRRECEACCAPRKEAAPSGKRVSSRKKCRDIHFDGRENATDRLGLTRLAESILYRGEEIAGDLGNFFFFMLSFADSPPREARASPRAVVRRYCGSSCRAQTQRSRVLGPRSERVPPSHFRGPNSGLALASSARSSRITLRA